MGLWPAEILVFSGVASCEREPSEFKQRSPVKPLFNIGLANGWYGYIPPPEQFALGAYETLRGLVVHQHGCGEGSCKSGLTGAFDLHWQALAKKHGCALLSPVYEQPEKANCQQFLRLPPQRTSPRRTQFRPPR